MQDSAKYLIHADITASGVVERSDVVGAVFGQTEGLLGDELDLRELQNAGQLGRIDVQVRSENGASFGSITIASGLDKVQTAILAAALESIERVGPCRATIEVSGIEDVRSAKRRRVVDRAKELLAEFDETALTNEELVEEVRRALRVEDITDYEGLPAGPRVAESDAIVVVEGRADVLTLLRYGVKNAVAVEGTNVPDAVADLTAERTVTAFLDGDRGGTLILRELAQVGDIDYVAFAPDGRSVEDLTRGEVMDALRRKVRYEVIEDESDPAAALAATDGCARPAPPEAVEPRGGETGTRSGPSAERSPDEDGRSADHGGPDRATQCAGDLAGESDETVQTDADAGDERPSESDVEVVDDIGDGATGDVETGAAGGTEPGAVETGEEDDPEVAETAGAEPGETSDESTDGESAERRTIAGHVDAVGGTGRTRLLDDEGAVLGETGADEASTFEAIESATTVPRTVVVDGELSQRVLDVAAQRGVEQIVAREEGEFVKQPIGVHVRLVEEF